MKFIYIDWFRCNNMNNRAYGSCKNKKNTPNSLSLIRSANYNIFQLFYIL